MKRIIVRLKNHKFIAWLPLFVVITFMSGLVYITMQQTIRLGANDAPLQAARDAVDDLTSGVPPATVASGRTVNIAKSLRTYVMIYDEFGEYVTGNAQLDGQTPNVPIGVFDFARIHSQNRVTWEPKDGVRQAIVVEHYNGNGGGFVLSGRSLEEIERRETMILEFVVVFWMAATIASLAVALTYTESVKISESKV